MAELQAILVQNEAKLKVAQEAQADLMRKERELADAKREFELTIEKRVNESVDVVRQKAKAEAEAKANHKSKAQRIEEHRQATLRRRQMEDDMSSDEEETEAEKRARLKQQELDGSRAQAEELFGDLSVSKKRTGKALSLTALLEAPTVEALAGLIEPRSPSTEGAADPISASVLSADAFRLPPSKTLITIRPAPSAAPAQPPLFFVHDGTVKRVQLRSILAHAAPCNAAALSIASALAISASSTSNSGISSSHSIIVARAPMRSRWLARRRVSIARTRRRFDSARAQRRLARHLRPSWDDSRSIVSGSSRLSSHETDVFRAASI
jgi:hypothetical protein